MKYKVKKKCVNIPDEFLLEDLRNTARKLGKDSLEYREYSARGSYSPQAVRAHFGTWNLALELAGLKVKRHGIITHEDLMENIKMVWVKLGRQPRLSEMRKDVSKYCWRVYTTHCGSWNNALDAFTVYIESGKHKKKGKKKSLMETAKELAGMKKRKLSRKHISKALRYDIMKRDHFKCRLCGRSPATDPKVILHIDHIIPHSKGGKSTKRDLQTLCDYCNYGKKDKV